MPNTLGEREKAVSESVSRAGVKRRILLALLLTGLAFFSVSLRGGEPAQAQADGENDREARIIGGTDVPNGKYPFVVALLDKRYGSSAFQSQFCGGSLIDRDTVLTAAHCVKGNVASNLRVTVGRTVLSSTQGQVRDILRINIHPRYNASTQAYDAAVLKLSSPVTGIAPVRLPATTSNGYETPGRSLTVAGWGNTVAQPAGGSAGASYPDRMREAQVPVVSDATADGIYGNYVPSLMVAAGRTGKDTCQGDSGGPMFARVSTSTGVVYYQVGITSFGVGCGAAGYPGVYAEVNNSSIRNHITYWAAR